MNRRRFFKTSALCGLALTVSVASLVAADTAKTFAARAITKGPGFHWFGYYDKLQFDPSNRYVLSNKVAFEHRSPKPTDKIIVGMIDLQDNDKWIELGTSSAWGWQQGCMLQWVPGTESKVIWNDHQDGRFVSHLLDIKTGNRKTLPHAIYALSPDGKWAVGADFARIQHFRPGYGYKGGVDPYADQNAPENSGIYKMDLETGESTLIVRLSDMAKLPHNGEDISKKWHYFNHLLVSPDGQRLIFLNRWRNGNNSKGQFYTRMGTVNHDGTDPHFFDKYDRASHFIWRDPEHIAAYIQPNGQKRKFYLMKDQTNTYEPIGHEKMPHNGHNTYLPHTNNEWILNDTYPRGNNREQINYLYHVTTDRRIELGRFHSPKKYRGEWRCDTHPRSSNNGKMICIDSPHGGNGRQIYIIDISDVF